MAAKLLLKTLAISATATAAPLSATDLWVRQLVIQCLTSGTNEVYVGDSSVTSSTGLLVAAGSSLAIDPNAALTKAPQQINLKDIYVRCAAAETASVIVMYMVEDFDHVAPV